MASPNDNKLVGGLIVGGLAGGVIASLLRAKPAAAAPDTAKLDYVTTVVEQIAQNQAALSEAIASIPSVQLSQDVTDRLGTIINSMDKEFLHNPEKMCAVLWLNFPNLCYPVPLAFAITLAPGATITIDADVAPGFVEVMVSRAFSTVDLDFVMSLVQLYDNGKLLGQDPAMVSVEAEIREWLPVLTRWTLVLTNNSLLFNCTFHSLSVTYAIEAHVFNYIKNKMRELGLTIIPEEVPS